MMAYSGYQLAFAGSIAEEYQRMGMQVTAEEIRARAALGLVTSALVLWQDRAALARARAANPTATSEY
jgi:pyruvate dehydrogenase complex dehydrogenase (E1) component